MLTIPKRTTAKLKGSIRERRDTCAFTEIGNLPAGIGPLLRIERAVVDRTDRIR